MPRKPPIEIKVSLTGADEETGFTKDVIAKDIERSTERLSKISRINLVNIDIKRHGKGGRVKYSVRIEATGDGAHHADAHEWSLEKAMQEALARLEKEMLKKKGKRSSTI
jgi:ribosome-associated translation inhibitor RaiA